MKPGTKMLAKKMGLNTSAPKSTVGRAKMPTKKAVKPMLKTMKAMPKAKSMKMAKRGSY